MKKQLLSILCASLWVGGTLCVAAPLDPEVWPSVVNTNKLVHYMNTDGDFQPLGAGWSSTLTILSGGDQITESVTVGGHQGLKATVNNLNTADSGFTDWATNDTIDILMQVYGDAAVLNAGAPRNFNFLIGALPDVVAPNGGQIPVAAKNQKWNWVLFSITNGIRALDGGRFVGTIAANAQGAFTAGGVNGGTIRLEGVSGLTLRVLAWGEPGAFGAASNYTEFLPPDACAAEPDTNLAFLDLQHTNANHLMVFNDGDQTTEIGLAGPPADQRRAVRATQTFMNFGITDNFLGLPCNDPHAMKVCVEFYDDPALIGAKFGPEAYATDALGGVGSFDPAKRYTLLGSGAWIRVAFILHSVNLKGVNTALLTGGPRLIFENGNPFISRYNLAVLRVSPSPLAGQDPLADCYQDPNICTTNYGNYAEMDLPTGVLNGLAPGSSGGDQEMIQATAGPTNDLRLAIRPAGDDGTPGFAHRNLNLAITGEVFGPSSQDNAQMAILMNYYDDPALTGKTFRPQVWRTDDTGLDGLAFSPTTIAVGLEGTGRWREAYFEIANVKFYGVNQGPQAAARFEVSSGGKIFFSRVRYAVIRPCGPFANVNLLAEHKSPTLNFGYAPAAHKLNLTWPGTLEGWTVQTSDGVSPWQTVTNQPVLASGHWGIALDTPDATRFFRLRN